MRSKRWVLLGAVAALVMAGELTAQGVAPAPTRPGEVRPDDAGRRRAGGVRARRVRQRGRQLLTGITLSETQQSQMKAIADRYRAQYRSLRDPGSSDRQAMRGAKQRGDTAAMRAAREVARKNREQAVSLRQRQMTELRGVLTPEQQRVFDQNVERQREHVRRKGGGRRVQ